MKPTYFYQLLFALFISASAFGAENKANEAITTSGTKFTYPLIEKWIAEYAKVNPNTNIKLAAKTANSQAVEIGRAHV